MVQDTFIAFLEGIKRFRENCSSIEKHFSSRSSVVQADRFFPRQADADTCFIQDLPGGSGDSDEDFATANRKAHPIQQAGMPGRMNRMNNCATSLPMRSMR